MYGVKNREKLQVTPVVSACKYNDVSPAVVVEDYSGMWVGQTSQELRFSMLCWRFLLGTQKERSRYVVRHTDLKCRGVWSVAVISTSIVFKTRRLCKINSKCMQIER